MAKPTFILYENDGTTEVYEFEKVTNWEPDPFQDPTSITEHLAVRGQGSQVSEGSLEPWDFTLTFLLIDDDYETLISQISSLVSTIAFNTQYILKIRLTSSPATYKSLKVKRLTPIQFPIEGDSKVVRYQKGIITLRVLTWA